jgi:predicted metal-dependent hydrolase
MKTIRLNNKDIPYRITKKGNKNTYYYFKKDGYIQINLAKKQTPHRALLYMKDHANDFIDKFHTHCLSRRDHSKYYLWGLPYEIVETEQDDWFFDHEHHVLYQPRHSIDQNGLFELEMTLFETELKRLIDTYQTNPYVSIENVTYSIKSMTSRHGSCNKQKRRISMNVRLIHHNKDYLEYVFLHEISHLVHDNHSQEFYQLLGQLCPNYKTLRQELHQDF